MFHFPPYKTGSTLFCRRHLTLFFVIDHGTPYSAMSPVVWGKSSADDAIFGALMEGASGATVDNRANVFSSIVLFPIHVPIALPFDWDTLRPGRIIGEAMTVMDSWLPFVADYRRNTATLGIRMYAWYAFVGRASGKLCVIISNTISSRCLCADCASC